MRLDKFYRLKCF